MNKISMRFFLVFVIVVVLFISHAAVPQAPSAPDSAPPRLDAWRILGPG